MNVQHHPFLLERPGDRDIHGQWHVPAMETKGTVLFLHGYKGYMDWGAWNRVGDHFASTGWRFLRINFTHNGTTPERPSEFNDLKAFAANTYSRELDEAVATLRALRTPGSTEESRIISSLPLAVIGHSRGGGIACLAAEEADRLIRQDGSRGVDHLITWAAVADFQSRFPTGEELMAWKSSGHREVIHHRTRQRLHHNWSFYQDAQDHRDRLHIESAMSRFGGTTLVVHGEDDPAVKLDHAQRLAGWGRHTTLFVLKEAGHTFGAQEPWIKPHLPAPLMATTQTTLHFLEEGRAAQR